MPVDGQLIQFLTHDEGFGVVIQPSAVGVRQLGTAGTSILAARISYTVTNDTRHPTPHHTLLLPIHDGPIPAKPMYRVLIPIGCFRYDQIPVPAFSRFPIASHITKCLMNGHVSGLEAGVGRGEQSSLDEAVIADSERQTRATEESPVKCDQPVKSTSTIQTSLPKADCSYP